MKQFIFLVLIVFFISCENKSKNEYPKYLVDNFFEIYETKGANDALDNIFQTNEYMIKQSKSDIETLKESLYSHLNTVGNYHGYEIISEYSLGKSISHYCCVVKYDKQPIRFNFTFYKAKNSWVLYGLNFDNNIMGELDDMAKFHYY
ncbi:hypothetical protein FACS189437_10470 [Bacteroidia bacterium]|nr:hypothetical protein FACS189437_10470 [Bacteroidia bacterium]